MPTSVHLLKVDVLDCVTIIVYGYSITKVILIIQVKTNKSCPGLPSLARF